MSIHVRSMTENMQNDLMDAFYIDRDCQPREKALDALAERIKFDTPKEVLDRWLCYNGVIGYTDSIVDMWEKLNEAATTGRIEDHH